MPTLLTANFPISRLDGLYSRFHQKWTNIIGTRSSINKRRGIFFILKIKEENLFKKSRPTSRYQSRLRVERRVENMLSRVARASCTIRIFLVVLLHSKCRSCLMNRRKPDFSRRSWHSSCYSNYVVSTAVFFKKPDRNMSSFENRSCSRDHFGVRKKVWRMRNDYDTYVRSLLSWVKHREF